MTGLGNLSMRHDCIVGTHLGRLLVVVMVVVGLLVILHCILLLGRGWVLGNGGDCIL